LKKDDCPKGDFSPSYYDGICTAPAVLRGSGEATGDFEHGSSDKTSEDGQDEILTAYDWAFSQ
jgi:hypothetical protein